MDHAVVGRVVGPTKDGGASPASAMVTGTVRFESVSTADLVVRHTGDYPVRARVIDAVGGLQTGRAKTDAPVAPVGEERVLAANADDNVLPLAIIGRHGGVGGIGRGSVRGLGLERDAVGPTVAHDVHNCIIVGTDHDSMATVMNHPRDVGGGAATYDPEDDALSSLVPPMGGLMSDESLGTVEEAFEPVEATADGLGLDYDGGLMVLSFLALEVIPTYRLTNNEPADMKLFEYVPTVINRQQDDRRGA